MPSGKARNVRFSSDIDRHLFDLAQLTNRSEPDIIRAAVEMLLADGLQAADQRLSQRLHERSHNPATGLSPEQRAEFVATGALPPAQRKKGRVS